MKNLLLVCGMILFFGTAVAQKAPQKPNTTKIVSDPTAHPLSVDTVKNVQTAKKNTSQKIGTGKKQESNTTKIVSDPTANPLHLDTVKNAGIAKKKTPQNLDTGKKQKPNTTKIVSDPTAHPLRIDTIKNPIKKGK